MVVNQWSFNDVAPYMVEQSPYWASLSSFQSYHISIIYIFLNGSTDFRANLDETQVNIELSHI